MTSLPLRIVFAVAAVLLFGWTSPSNAAICTVSSQSVSFGSYDPFSPADLDAVGNLRLECDATVSATISLSTGAGSFAARQMSNGTSQLAYNLYTSAQRTTVWGDGTGGSSTVSVNMQSGDVPVYGRIPARQNVTVGTYEDSVVVTVTY